MVISTEVRSQIGHMMPIKKTLNRMRRATLHYAVNKYMEITPNAVITNGPFTWDHHGMAARTAIDWFNKDFALAYDKSWTEIESLGLNWNKRPGYSLPIRRENFHNEWNIHVCCWAGENALKLEGDFVECGVGVGIFSRLMMNYLDLGERKFWLLDRWSPGDTASFVEDFNLVKKIFAPYKNAWLVQGTIPDTLDRVTSDKIAYLYIDLNSALPEIEAAEYFWPKLVSGGYMLLDDFGFPGHEPQKEAFIKFAREKNVPILFCPTGQGVIIKTAS